ncbi:MAG TPA: methyltransferase [Acidimicrobiales bacterium]|nr:methyltransferase [Acidimicrobiales bacterium]
MIRAAGSLETTTAELRAAGCVAAAEEAAELMEAAGGDPGRLRALVARRCSGEPLAWLTGSVRFGGETVLVHRGVYVPRWQSEPLAFEAAARLPEDGLAADLCTGAGAVAVVLARRRPRARVVATEIDPVAVACARSNGVEVYEGDMAAGLPDEFRGRIDVVTAVVPYVPRSELRLLPRDVTAYEPLAALDGGEDGTDLLVRAVGESAVLLRPGGSLLLELGGDEAELLQPVLESHHYTKVEFLLDEDGDLRALACQR